jgi:hypothetical protein
MTRKSRKPRSMHVDTGPRTYRAADGTVHEYQQALLRRSYRNAQGKPAKETLANLSMLPDKAVEALQKSLAGKTLVEPDAAFEIGRAVAHGHVAAVHTMASRLKFDELLGPSRRERDLAYALIVSRVVAPQSKPSTIRWWADTSLGMDLDIAAAHVNELYAAVDWLLSRQGVIEKRLADRHLRPGEVAFFDLTSASLENHYHEPDELIGARRGKGGLPQIEFGFLSDAAGRPVAVRVLAGSGDDARLFLDEISAIHDQFGLPNLIMTGRCGVITEARVKALKTRPDLRWVTELPAPAVAALAGPDGPLRIPLFDTGNAVDITNHAFSGERLVCCRDTVLADERARMRDALLHATEQKLDRVAALVAANRLRGAARISIRVGKYINKNTVGRHFITIITDDGFTYRRNVDGIVAEAALDGIRMIRTSVDRATLAAGDMAGKYQNLYRIQRELGSIRSDDLNPEPAPRHRADQIRAHLLLCMLTAYLNWHLRRAFAPLTGPDDNILRSRGSGAVDDTRKTRGDQLEYDYPGLIAHLGQLTRNTVSIADQRFEKITRPTPVQHRIFELLNSSIPHTLVGRRHRDGLYQPPEPQVRP